MTTTTTTEPGPQLCTDCKQMIYSYPQWYNENCTVGKSRSHNVPDWPKLLVGKVCPECLEPKPEDDRVAEGMKCGTCAYGTDPEA